MSSAHAQAEYFQQSHVHTGDDGRGLRRVLVGDVECQHVCYADTVLGIAVAAFMPLRVVPGTEDIDQYVVMGDVCVEPMNATDWREGHGH
ncbi:hypothetical protein [Pseudomonas petrae]|uniref:Uncharacterized protein n=1 Tax=Pseudomonas petrae TaxID=2912190 RepID=A0ABS9IE46_9PSED|nr:hypothetical protein [Pseudomonas petrae]MCF7545566.1 hypothetical protein [Pseudomonas petrae]